MAERQSSNPDYKTKDAMDTVASLVDDIVYIPSHAEAKLKAEFWVKWQDGPVRSADKITSAAVAQVLGRQTLNKSWSKVGFKEWFTNSDEFRISAEQYALEAIEITRQVMYQGEKDADKLKAARTLMELGNKFATKQSEIVVADAAIQKMDVSELKEFIKQNAESIQTLIGEADES